MAIMRFNYRSQEIGHYVDITVVLPTDEYSYYDEQKEGRGFHLPGEKPKAVYRPGMKFQTVYLIHGGGDDDSLTYRYTSAECYAQRNHVMLVTPNIANSFGVDTEYGVKYASFLTKELPVVIRTLFASSPRREDNFILGYAMGGNVALGTALMHPELYAECVDVCGGIGMTLHTETLAEELNSDHFKNHFRIYNTTFGDAERLEGSRFDIRAQTLAHLKNGDTPCKFHVICGSDEFIRARVEADVSALRELGLDVEYTCAQGYAHDFRIWDDYIAIALDQMLPLKRSAIWPE